MGVHQFANISRGVNITNPPAGEPSLASFLMTDPKRVLRQKRSLIQWQVPHIGSGQFIEMYINPQNLQFQSRKEIATTRTKGGFIAQYWGEALDEMTLSGTTGTSGIEGINVLRDAYRSEHLALQSILQNRPFDKRRQSLMQLAASVTMWYQGQGYRGFFTNMQYTESVNTIGLFDYTMSFTVVEIKGKRKNFLPWHRHPWSTTQTPNAESDQGSEGGAFAPGDKVGALNAPNMSLKTVIIANPRDQEEGGVSQRVIQVAVLRGDPKDPSTKGFGKFRASASGRRAEEVNVLIDRRVRQASQDEEGSGTTGVVKRVTQSFGLVV